MTEVSNEREKAVQQVYQTLALMRSMIESGESFTDSSLRRYREARGNLETLAADAQQPEVDGLANYISRHLSKTLGGRIVDEDEQTEAIQEAIESWNRRS